MRYCPKVHILLLICVGDVVLYSLTAIFGKDVKAAVIRTLAASLREYKKPAVLTLLIIMGEVFFEVLIPFYTADMVNMIKAGEALSAVMALGGKLVLMAIASLLCGAVAARTWHLCRRRNGLCQKPARGHVCPGAELFL